MKAGTEWITYRTNKGEVNVHKSPECHKCARCGEAFSGPEFRLNFRGEACHTCPYLALPCLANLLL